MTYYGGHIAPYRIQNSRSFENIGDIFIIYIPYGLPNIILEKKLCEEGFYCDDDKCYKKNINKNKFKELVIQNKEELENTPNMKKLLQTHKIEETTYSSNLINQSYTFMSLNTDDYLIIRGKKSKLPEAYVFQLVEQGEIKYDEDHKPYMRFRVICKCPNDVYNKLRPVRRSIWNLNDEEIEEIKNIL